MASGQSTNVSGRLASSLSMLERGGLVLVVLVAWLLTAYTGIAFYVFQDHLGPLISTDDAMRLVQVRDLLAGQSWYDLQQYRLGLEGGTEMHWSRLVDAPIALLILGLSPLFGSATAETIVMYVWPLIILIPALVGTALATHRIAGLGAAWITTLLMGVQLGYSGRYSPGHLDHHNVQLTLFILALSAAALAPRSRAATICLGSTIAASLAVGVEHLPAHAAIALLTALNWLAAGATVRPNTLSFAVSFIATLWVLFLLTAPASAYSGGYCDALSIDLALPATAGAIGLALAVLLTSDQSLRVRTLALIGAGVLAVAAVLWVPACLTNPLGSVDAFLREHWLDRVAEAQTLWSSLATGPQQLGPNVVAALIGLLSAVLLAARREDTWTWLLFAGTIVVCLPFAFFQLRGVIALGPLAVIPAGVLAVRLFVESRRTRKNLPGFAAIAVAALLVPTAVSQALELVGHSAQKADHDQTAEAEDEDPFGLWGCFRPGAMDTLAALPQGLVSASSNMGPQILLETPHRVLAGPYHRNTAGMTAQLRVALGTDEYAEQQLRDLDVDYVVTCGVDGEYVTTERYMQTGFGFRLQAGEVPDFLEPLPPEDMPGLDGTPEASLVRIYRLKSEE